MKNSNIDYRNEGSVSEWNEGNFKNLRLHEAQELINTSKLNPLIKNSENSYYYNLWISGIEILYGEGHSKYTNEEIGMIERIKGVIIKCLAFYPPIKKVFMKGMYNKGKKDVVDYQNWERLRKLIELFEQKVKLFNDKHGLSTRNYDYNLEGL